MRAKNASGDAIKLQQNEVIWHQELTLAVVDIAKYNEKIREYYLDKQREYFYELRNEIQNMNGQNASFANYFMIDTLFYTSGRVHCEIILQMSIGDSAKIVRDAFALEKEKQPVCILYNYVVTASKIEH